MRYVGVCNYQAWQVCRALWVQERINAAPLITVQNPYSLLNRALEGEMFPLVRALGLGVMAYAPLATGLLSGAYRPGQPPPPAIALGASDGAGRLERGAGRPAGRGARRRRARWPSGPARRWRRSRCAGCISHPEVTVAISGADTDAQLDENLGALDVAAAAGGRGAARRGLGRTCDVALDGPQYAPVRA